MNVEKFMILYIIFYICIIFLTFKFISYNIKQKNHTKISKNNLKFLKENLIAYEYDNIELERYGPKGDGGYILCKNLLNIADIIYSYGINDEDAIGCELSNKLNIDVYQYDCFSKNPGCHKNAYFKNECVGNKKELRDNKKYNTFENHIIENNHVNKRLLVLMDIEGSEYETILSMPLYILKQIVQLNLEIHWFLNDFRGSEKGYSATEKNIDYIPNFELFKKMMNKLLLVFDIVHIHCNNNSCALEIPCDVIEVLFVNKELTNNKIKKLELPLDIDTPNQPYGPFCDWNL